MRFRLVFSAIVGAVLIVILVMPGITQEKLSQWDGIYTQAQADRGAVLFEQNCIVCHSGGMAPDLIGQTFNNSWTGSTIGDLFQFIESTMPQNLPGSLEEQDYLDIIAHLLDAGGFPEGMDELRSENKTFFQISFIIPNPRESDIGDSDQILLTDAEFQRLISRVAGRWEFRPEKSTYSKESPPDRWYVIYEKEGERTIKFTNRRFNSDGQETISVSRQVLDGFDYLGPSENISISRLALDEHTISTTLKLNGKTTSRNTQFFSSDGQRMVIVQRRLDEEGEHWDSVSIFDKVEK